MDIEQQSTPKPVLRTNVGPHWSLNSAGRRQPLPEPWDAPTFILQREEAPVTPRSVGGIHHSFTTATSADREHEAQQKRDGLVASRRQQAADRVLLNAVEPARARCATKQSLDEQTSQRSSAQAEVRQVVAGEERKVIEQAVAQERNIQARQNARRTQQQETAQHNLETIKAKEAAKAAQRKSELAHDRSLNESNVFIDRFGRSMA